MTFKCWDILSHSIGECEVFLLWDGIRKKVKGKK